MLVKTKYFGEINLSEDKIITMERGMFGFEEYKKYTLLSQNYSVFRKSGGYLAKIIASCSGRKPFAAQISEINVSLL